MAKKPVSRNDVRINLSHEEMRRLLHLVYIGTWVMSVHKTEENPRTAPYEELEQELYAVAARGAIQEAGNF